MAFLDNSGDIILDAVLTDTGRARLAKGDGSFRIAKFAFGDDEVNYGSFNKNHSSGSAYYDLEVLQTPVLEAFTNNTSTMKSKLISIPRTNLLYLPMLKINEVFAASTKMHSSGAFFVAVDKDTEDAISKTGNNLIQGIVFGENPEGGAHVRIDQGLDTKEIPPGFTIDADLVETQYIVELDNRFGKLVSVADASAANVSFVDDDNVASYYFSLGTDTDYVKENTDRTTANNQTIRGPRGTLLQFGIQSSLELNTSTFLFEQLGSTTTMKEPDTNVAVYYIDSIARVTGATTGYSVDVPVRFIKKQ